MNTAVNPAANTGNTGNTVGLATAGPQAAAGPFVPQQNAGFLLFSPDALFSGRYAYALDYLAGLGIHVKGVSRLHMTPEQVDGLYAKNRRDRSDRPEDRLVDRLFGAGPSLACWLVSGSLRGPSLVDTLRVLKGPSDPAGCHPGHLRHVLGAENGLMNGVHSSDSPEEAAQEIGTLGITEFTQPEPRQLPPEPGDCANGQSAGRPTSALAVACLLRRRVFDAAHLSVPKTRDIQAEAEALAGRHVKPSGVLATLGTLWDRQHGLIRAAAPKDDALIACLTRVAEICSSSFDADRLTRAVAPFGVVLSDWEDLVLRCQAHFGALPGWRDLE
ncbi:nucleoside-diphosphate kinase [Streptomyces sp. NPDC048516]|uniref:nucleoside-diphosphate kinase n=1 Tax=Streptomyces sp. NPDC048516 TaxID=3365565 RepID=UPI0037101494